MRFAMVDEDGNYKKLAVGGSRKNADAASKVACELINRFGCVCICIHFDYCCITCQLFADISSAASSSSSSPHRRYHHDASSCLHHPFIQ